MKILHFVPSYRGRVHAGVAQAMTLDVGWAASRGFGYQSLFLDVSGIDIARNRAVKHARDIGADLLLMQDEDCFGADPSISTLGVLFDVMRRKDAHLTAACFLARVDAAGGSQTSIVDTYTPIGAADQHGDVEVSSIGTGLMLVDLRKLRDMPLPWFWFTQNADGTDWAEWEDRRFVQMVRDRGGRVFVAGSHPTVHVGERRPTFQGVATAKIVASGVYGMVHSPVVAERAASAEQLTELDASLALVDDRMLARMPPELRERVEDARKLRGMAPSRQERRLAERQAAKAR